MFEGGNKFGRVRVRTNTNRWICETCRVGESDILPKRSTLCRSGLRHLPGSWEVCGPNQEIDFLRRLGPVRFITKSLTKYVLGTVLTGALALSGALSLSAQEKKWKDQAEYDLYTAISKAQDPNEQLKLLAQWKEKYPESDYKLERAQTVIFVMNKKNDANGVFQASRDLLALQPDNFQALYFVTILPVSLNKQDADSWDAAIKAANGLIAAVPTNYAPGKKPANVTDDQWKQQGKDIEVAAYKTLGWVEWQKKNYTGAEAQFKKGLEVNPNAAELSYFLGTVIVLQKNAARQLEAIWQFGRAGYLEGPAALDPARKQQVASYFQRVFGSFTGADQKETGEMIEKIKSSLYPPDGFKLESKEERMAKNEEKFKSENPMLFMFMQVKKGLQAADGATYWDGTLKDAELPTFKGKLVSQKPETNPKELVVAISTADTPEVTIVLETALRGKAEPGTELEFTGVAKEFTKEPFTLKVEVEKEKLKGWPVTGPATKAAPKKAAAPAAGAPKKAAVKKK